MGLNLMKQIILLTALSICSTTYSMNNQNQNLQFPRKKVILFRLKDAQGFTVNVTVILPHVADKTLSSSEIEKIASEAFDKYNARTERIFFPRNHVKETPGRIIKTTIVIGAPAKL